MLNERYPQPTSIPLPENIAFKFEFEDSDVPGDPIDINHPVIQRYPDYLSFAGDIEFFDELNKRLIFLHSLVHFQNGIGNDRTFVTDIQGRIFQLTFLHVSDVPT